MNHKVELNYAAICESIPTLRDELKWYRSPSFAPKSREHAGDNLKRGRTAMDLHGVCALSQPQRRKQSGNAENMVEVSVRQQESIELNPHRFAATVAGCPLRNQPGSCGFPLR